MLPSAIILDGLKRLERVELALADAEFNIGETGQTQLKGIFNDESEADLTEAEITYASSNEEAATVDENGLITAVGEGNAEISATVVLGGVTKSAGVAVEVIDPTPLASVELSGQTEVAQDRWIQLAVSGLMESGRPAYLPNAQVRYELISCEPEGAVTLNETGLVSGVTVGGVAEIRAQVTLREKTVATNTLQITVTENHPEIIDIILRGKTSGKTAMTASFEEDGWQLNRAKSSPAMLTNETYFRYMNSYGIQARLGSTVTNTPVTSDTAYDVMIPYEGWYTFEFSGGGYNGGALVDIYLDDVYMGE